MPLAAWRSPLGAAAVCGLLAALVLAASGCGNSTHDPRKATGLSLERSQLVLIINGLRAAEPSVEREVSASRAVWPAIAAGLPSPMPAALRKAIERAHALASRLPQPSFMASAASLTGPAAGLASLYEDFYRLAQSGWRLTEAAARTIAGKPPSGSPSSSSPSSSPPPASQAAARFTRANSSLYIDVIYDAHYDLSLLGKSLPEGYTRIAEGYESIGGEPAFGTGPTQAQVDALARAYSIDAVRLTPHPKAK